MTSPDHKDTGSRASRERVWRLVHAVQELSLARTLTDIATVVRTAAREIADADGATFVLRDAEHCYYFDEDAISPLWKGQRFPMTACISGWTMLNRQPAVVPDIYLDARIPHDAYRPTFVKSLVMTPIRTADPVGAIGVYWGRTHEASEDEVRLLAALTNTTSVALENVRVYEELEKRVVERTRQLESANRELEAFAYSLSHDLRAPVRQIGGFTDLLGRELGTLEGPAASHMGRIQGLTQRMHALIDDMLKLSRIHTSGFVRTRVDMSAMARAIVDGLQAATPGRQVTVRIAPALTVDADAGLIRILLDNLLSNAWKYTGKRDAASIEFGGSTREDGTPAYFVRDNGAGFDMQYAKRLGAPFQRFHHESEFPGTGIGLATVQRIVHRHGGELWAASAPDQGATFWFTIA